MKRRPNILFLFTDQQRSDTIAALGNPIIRTPVLDRLVQEGTAFTRCYSPSPVCMSARFALLTGTPPHINGCFDNQAGLDLARPSYASPLSAAGYQCHAVGKMHLAPDFRANVGFESRQISEELKPGDFANDVARSGFSHVIDPQGLRGEYYYLPQPSQLPAHLHESAWVADKAIEFLGRRDRERPFMLYAGFIKPHPPFESPTPWNRLYRSHEMPEPHRPPNSLDYQSRINRVQNRYKYLDRTAPDDRILKTIKAAYYGAISFLDFNIGRILDALGDEIDNTLIVFSSDHGELLGDYGCVGKRCMLEASVRVPLLVRFPESFEAGNLCATPVTLCDLYATFAETAGVPRHLWTCAPDTKPLASLTGRAPHSRIVCSQFQRGWMGNYMATDGRLKYAYSAPDRREWLWQVEDRLVESADLSRSLVHAETLERLRRHLQDWLRNGNHTEAVDSAGWREHAVPPFKGDQDENYGLIFQETPALQQAVDSLPWGYRRTVSRSEAENYAIITDHQG
jgi:arylsulfatase A-like enzyme